MLQTTSYCRENLNTSVTADRWILSANIRQVTFSSVNLTADYSHLMYERMNAVIKYEHATCSGHVSAANSAEGCFRQPKRDVSGDFGTGRDAPVFLL